ncbi:MAG: glutamine-hydrolyzing carbamoyl-phosphate synthase small subunit [Myxococcota bacterium]
MRTAFVALEDGTVLEGVSIGAAGLSAGEVVFNTSYTGYQEILTDPSYCRQIVTLTYPHVGNVGTNPADAESREVFSSGLIVRDLPPVASSWRSAQDLSGYLEGRGVVAVADIDTRRLTRILREKGAQRGCLIAGDGVDPARAVEAARAFPGLQGMDLAKVVTVTERAAWREGEWQLDGFEPAPSPSFRVVAYDFGVKLDILRILTSRGCEVELVPAQTPASEVLAGQPDGVFLSNGPGDPEPCDYAIEAIQEILSARIPTFGICLGHQLLALASGAKTEKMKFGHHGANHPVLDLATKRVMITSQNHGFCVSEEGLPDNLEVCHRSLFDQTIQGIRRRDVPAFGFQGHPEGSPGPNDAQVLFSEFIRLMSEHRAAHAQA